MNGREGTYTDGVEDTRAALLGDPDADERPTLGVGADDDDPVERSRRKRRNRKVLVVALVLLLVPVLAVGGYLAWLNQIVTNNVKQDQLLPEAAPLVDANGDAVSPPTGSGTNYLIIGNDAGPDRVGARSDVMVLVHVPADHRNVTLIHFPRDLWVPIPGRGNAKLNAAYAYGGAPLLVKTMQNMLGVKVDHVAMIGFEGFKSMTDAVGGVDVNVEEASEGDGKVFKEGIQRMDGETALVFVRQRYMLSEGDISRGQRQLAFIKALMLKTLSKEVLTNPIKLKDFTEAATEQPHGRPEPRRRHDAVGGLRLAWPARQRHPLHHGTVQRLRHQPRRPVDRRRRQGPHERPRQGHPRGRTSTPTNDGRC